MIKAIRQWLGIDPDPMVVANDYRIALDTEWQRYLDWRDAQVCAGCSAPFGTKDSWVTETLCSDCGWTGVKGKSRADYLVETGNKYL